MKGECARGGVYFCEFLKELRRRGRIELEKGLNSISKLKKVRDGAVSECQVLELRAVEGKGSAIFSDGLLSRTANCDALSPKKKNVFYLWVCKSIVVRRA